MAKSLLTVSQLVGHTTTNSLTRNFYVFMRKCVFTSSLCLVAFFGMTQEQSKLSKASNTESSQTSSTEISSEDQNKIQQRKSQKEEKIQKQQAQSEFVKGAKKSPHQYDDKGRLIITKEKFYKMSPERKKWISDQPDKYIVQ